MAERSFKKIRTGDRIVDGIQDNVSTIVSPITSNDLLYGNLLKGVVLTFGVENIVKHKLGRELQGYIVVGRNTDGIVWNETTTFPDRNISLYSSKDVTVDLYVF